VVKGADGLYSYLQSVQGYLAPPIFVVFFFGVFWKRLNAQGCFWSMVVGFVIGLFRMLVDTPITLGLFKSGLPWKMWLHWLRGVWQICSRIRST
jgi:SSS family solute:Na+ symporter